MQDVDDGYRSNWQRRRAGVPLQPEGWSRPVSPAITEQLCKTVVAHEERAKSLKDLIRAAMDNPSPYLPESPMTAAERAAFNWGFAEGMNVVLEYIKSGQPAPRG